MDDMRSCNAAIVHVNHLTRPAATPNHAHVAVAMRAEKWRPASRRRACMRCRQIARHCREPRAPLLHDVRWLRAIDTKGRGLYPHRQGCSECGGDVDVCLGGLEVVARPLPSSADPSGAASEPMGTSDVSASAESPTIHAFLSRAPASAAAAWKIAGSGLPTPSASEIAQASTRSVRAAVASFASCALLTRW